MTNMWGLLVQYPKRNDWDEWYKKDIDNSPYYLDWETILKYHVALGFKGIELMFHMEPYIREFFGTAHNFLQFIQSIGLEKITGTFALGFGAEKKEHHEELFNSLKNMVDFTSDIGGENINIMPASGYYGNGPLTREQIRNAAALMNRVGEYASEKGVLPCVHSEFWCAINKYDLEEYLSLLDHNRIGFCLDTAQVAIMGFEPADMYEKYHDIVKYIHLKDASFKNAPDEARFKAGAEFPDDGERWFFEPGVGVVDFKALYQKLKKYEHKGWITLETDGTPDPLATMALSRYYIDEVLSPIYC